MTKETIESANLIYKLMQDKESKVIFRNRLLYLITGERKYIHHMVEYKHPEHYQKFKNLCRSADEVILYGAGDYCNSVIEACEEYGGVKPSFICDSNSSLWGKEGPCGYMIISPNDLKERHKNATVIVSTVNGKDEIYNTLLDFFPKNRIFALGLNISETTLYEQYFDDEIIQFECDGEFFVDGGAYDLMTSKILSNKTKVNKVYAFEADPANANKIKNTISDNLNLNVELYMKGLWNKEEILYFDSGDEMESKITEVGETGNSKIEAIALDDVINDKVTFIKMDIEGAELKALEGARKTILKYRPKLAICIYHKLEDMIDIPLYIHKLVPEYKLYMRHYADFQYDSVLYAVL